EPRALRRPRTGAPRPTSAPGNVPRRARDRTAPPAAARPGRPAPPQLPAAAPPGLPARAARQSPRAPDRARRRALLPRPPLPRRRGPRPRPLLTALPAYRARACGAWFRSCRRRSGSQLDTRRRLSVFGGGRELGEHAGDRPRLAGWNVGVETGGHAVLSIARSKRALIISVISASMSLAPVDDGA